MDTNPYTSRGFVSGAIPPLKEDCLDIPAGPMRFVLESRWLNASVIAEPEKRVGTFMTPSLEVDSGASVNVIGTEGGLEHVRFDCFEKQPHYHYVRQSEQRKQILHIAEVAIGPIAWTLLCVRERLPEILEYADAKALAAAVRANRAGGGSGTGIGFGIDRSDWKINPTTAGEAKQMSKPSLPSSDTKLSISKLTADSWKNGAGRRAFIAYRDLGIVEATNGRLNIQASLIRKGSEAKPTGWHYHTTEMQVIYILSGWVDIQFKRNDTIRLSEGDCFCIPPGMPHNETAISDSFSALEIRTPKDIGVVSCDPPEQTP